MKVENHPKRLHRRHLALALTLAAIVVPTAQARVDGSSQWAGPGKSAHVSAAAQAERPSGRLQADTTESLGPPAGWPGVDPQAPLGNAAPIRQVSTPDGFDWADSAVGAGVVLLVTLLAADALATVRRMRRRATA